MSKTEMVRELKRLKGHFELYAKTCAAMADEAKPKSSSRADLNARADVWHGAALEVEQAIAAIKARPADRQRRAHPRTHVQGE